MRLFSKLRLLPLIQIRLLSVLSLISELRTVTLSARSRWKIWTPTQPPQSTVQPSTMMLLARSLRKVLVLAGPTKLMLLPPSLPEMWPFSRPFTDTASPAAVRKVTPGAPIEGLLGPIRTVP